MTEPREKRFVTDLGYAVGGYMEEIKEMTPSMIVKRFFKLRDCLKAVFKENERGKDNGSNVSLADAKKNGMVYNFEKSNNSVVIRGISV